MSPSSDAALSHLRKIKPNDGWAIDHKSGGTSLLVRLMRRNVPLTESFFFDIHHDPASNQVVGILTGIASGGGYWATRSKVVQAQVLVDASGRPTGSKIALVSVSGYNAAAAAAAAATATASKNRSQNPAASSSATAATNTGIPTLTDAQNRDLVMYGGVAIVAAIAFRILSSAVSSGLLSILLLPAVYIYLVSTCPSADTFDAKKELKRILRGHHLPENHRDKPHGLVSETLARIQASVVTEIATLPGYEVTTVSLAGACVVACTRVPSVHRDYYWVGAVDQWWYVCGTEIRNDGRVAQ